MFDQKQGQQLAFLPDPDVDALAEHLVSLANADGGLIVLGLNADGSKADEVWAEDAEGALQRALMQCKPPVMAQWQELETKLGQLISLRVIKSPDLHTLSDGRVLARHGSENRPISGMELVNLANSRTVAEYEAELVAGARLADLDEDILSEYLKKREARGAARVGTVESLLFEIGAIDKNEHATVSGILLFAHKPQVYLPQSGVVFVKFPTPHARGADGRVGYGRREEIGGSLARVVERTYNVIWEEMSKSATVRGLEREELTEYPRFAVREAVVNAICHRDYRIRGRRVEIRMYSDRLEIISPGGLAGYMTLENLVEEHYSRNPRIVNGLYHWGYIEELGLGIDQMYDDMSRAGHPEPEFKATPYSFTVTLRKGEMQPIAPVVRPHAGINLNQRQSRALDYVRRNGSITNREYQQLISDVSAETLRRDLAGLVKRGLLLKIGSKKGTHYILK